MKPKIVESAYGRSFKVELKGAAPRDGKNNFPLPGKPQPGIPRDRLRSKISSLPLLPPDFASHAPLHLPMQSPTHPLQASKSNPSNEQRLKPTPKPPCRKNPDQTPSASE